MNQKHTNEKSQLIKFYHHQSKEQFILFRPQIPLLLLVLFQQEEYQLSKKIFRQLHYQIGGLTHRYNNYLCQNQQSLIQILTTVSEYGGLNFFGHRNHPNLQNSIRLKLNHIQNITFTNLIFLGFNDCQINNIEALSWLHIKNVTSILLCNNKITSFKPLKKSYFPNISCLNLANNKFSYRSFQQLHRFYSFKLHSLQVQEETLQQMDTEHLQDLRNLVKLEIDKQKWNKKQKLTIYCDRQNQNLQNTKWKDKINQESIILLNEL